MRTALILGAQKCATSSLVGLLNCHPDVLCLYEADLPAPIPNSYAVRLLRSFPHWRDCFGGPVEPVNHYSRLAGRLAEDGHQYLCLLDKIPTLAPPWLTHAQTPPVIYAVRDVRTWLGKGSIDQMYVCEHNLVPAAVDYAMAFISSFRLGPERCLHVGVEEFLQVDSPVPRRVFEFLDVPYLAELDHWWELIAARQQEDSIKSTFNWLKFHPSSTRRPGASDTSVELSDHDFWGRYLPIFDEFRGRCNQHVPRADVDEALGQLRELRGTQRLARRDAFREVSTTSFGQAPQRPWRRHVQALQRLCTPTRSARRRAA